MGRWSKSCRRGETGPSREIGRWGKMSCWGWNGSLGWNWSLIKCDGLKNEWTNKQTERQRNWAKIRIYGVLGLHLFLRTLINYHKKFWVGLRDQIDRAWTPNLKCRWWACTTIRPINNDIIDRLFEIFLKKWLFINWFVAAVSSQQIWRTWNESILRTWIKYRYTVLSRVGESDG